MNIDEIINRVISEYISESGKRNPGSNPKIYTGKNGSSANPIVHANIQHAGGVGDTGNHSSKDQPIQPSVNDGWGISMKNFEHKILTPKEFVQYKTIVCGGPVGKCTFKLFPSTKEFMNMFYKINGWFQDNGLPTPQFRVVMCDKTAENAIKSGYTVASYIEYYHSAMQKWICMRPTVEPFKISPLN